jgi:hypothetical protein
VVGRTPGLGQAPRLFFRHFAGTSFVVEEDGEIFASLVCIVGSPADEVDVGFVGGTAGSQVAGPGTAALRDVLRRGPPPRVPIRASHHLPGEYGVRRLPCEHGLRGIGGGRTQDGVSIHSN